MNAPHTHEQVKPPPPPPLPPHHRCCHRRWVSRRYFHHVKCMSLSLQHISPSSIMKGDFQRCKWNWNGRKKSLLTYFCLPKSITEYFTFSYNCFPLLYACVTILYALLLCKQTNQTHIYSYREKTVLPPAIKSFPSMSCPAPCSFWLLLVFRLPCWITYERLHTITIISIII